MTACAHICISEPLSWFVLEQYHVGDLDSKAKSETERHLAECSVCREVYRHIERDEVSLPDLPTPISKPRDAKVRSAWAKRVVPLVAAAAVALFVLLLSKGESGPPPSHIVTKGGELALSLVRQRGESVRENPEQFESGDTFRLLVTSPFKDGTRIEVAVFQEGETSFPYPEGLAAEFGNQTALDGAFTLKGDDDAVICVLVDSPESRMPTRREIAAEGIASLPENSVCVTLTAE